MEEGRGHYPIKPSPLIINKNKMNSKIDYAPVEKTGVLTSSIYEDGNTIMLGEKTHLALIENSDKKFAAFEVINAKNKSGDTLVLNEQSCEDGNFSVFAISCLKTKRVYSSELVTSTRRLSSGMSIAQIMNLEPNKEYRLTKTQDGFKKPFGWKEGEELVQNHSYRLETVATPDPAAE